MASVDGIAQHLTRFQTADLIRQVQAAPEQEYWFKHILIQEAIYDSLLKSARVELHGQVAAAIERLAAGQDEERPAILALHYERAGLYAKAFDCAMAAGDRARRVYAHREALDFYDRALAAARRLADPRVLGRVPEVYASRGAVYQVIGDHAWAAESYREMLAAATETGDLATQADALIRLATVQIISGGAADLTQNLERALALAHQSGDPILLGRALWSQGLALRFNDPLTAIELWRQALALAQETDAPGARELAASVLIDLRVGMVVVGRLREALAYSYQAEAAFRDRGNQPMVADALGGLALIAYMQGDVATSRAAGIEGLRLSRELGNPWGIVYNEWSVLLIELDAGRFEGALASTERRLAEARLVGFPAFVGAALMQTAFAFLEAGAWNQARAAAAESRLVFDENRSPMWSTWGRGVEGRVLTATGDLARAHELLDGLWQPGEDVTARMEGFLSAGPAIAELALADYRSTHDGAQLKLGLQFCDWYLSHTEAEESWRLAGEMRYLRGRLHQAAGDWPAAEADLLQARAWLTATETVILLWRIDAALAELYAARNDAVRAAEAHGRAVELIHRLAAGIADPALRRSFLARPDVQEALA